MKEETITRIFFFLLVQGHTADDYLLGARGGPRVELLQEVCLHSSPWNRKGKRYLTVECKVTQPCWFMTHDGWKIHSCWHPDLSPSCWKLWRMRISYTAKGEIMRPFYPMDYSRKTPTPIERDPETLRKTWCVGATPWASLPSAPICTPAVTG